ncbi:MerR family transcriptional regulator [Paraburkholderia sediminicola]|uniref:MerR family transcriptional regulator n=1 Tax=Paraburkholderia sediminicola TaxID=458836 RepID=UPI0038BDFACA
MLLKVGELARRSGITVRTLHHYDAIGLLTPSARSDAGYRLYNRDDIARLHQIQAMRRLDLSLADIGALLAKPDSTLSTVIEQQIAALTQQIDRATDLRDRLHRLRGQLMTGEEPDLADWLTTLELMTMQDKYLTPDEQSQLRSNKLAGAANWAALIQAVHALMDRGSPVESPEVQALASRWMSMVAEYTGGDPRLLSKLDTMHRNEPALQVQSGITMEMLAYMTRAVRHSKFSLYAKYLSPQELQRMRDGDERYVSEWPGLVAEVRSAMDNRKSVDDPSVQKLAQRWMDLFNSYVGTDPETHRKLQAAYENEPAILAGTGIDRDMLAYLREALQATQPQ